MGIIRDSFIIFKNWADAINALPEEYQLEAYKSLVAYGTSGQMPDDISQVTKALLISFSVGMENSICRYNASVNNGKLGGRPPKKKEELETQGNLEKPSITQDNLDEPTHNLNVNVNDNVNKNNIVVVDNLSTNITHACEETTTSTTIKELQSLCTGLEIDCNIEDLQNYDLKLLIQKVKESRYLKLFRSLRELLSKYDNIIKDKYKDFVVNQIIKYKSGCDARKREYTKEQLDSMFDDIYSVQI